VVSLGPLSSGPTRWPSFLKRFQRSGLKPRPRPGLNCGVFFHEGHASPGLCSPTLLKFKETCPYGQYREGASHSYLPSL
jgi:hypothetical protein